MTLYFPNLQKTAGVLAWLYREFIDQKARRYYRAVIFWVFLLKITEMIAPWCLGLMAIAITAPNTTPTPAFLGFVLTNFARVYVDWRASRARELFIGQAFRGLDGGINRRFFEKDLGLHLEEGRLLGAATLEKGRQRADTLLHLATWWFADSLLVLGITLPIMAYISPIMCVIVAVGMCLSTIFSFVVNRRVLQEAEVVEEEFRMILDDAKERREAVERIMTTAFEKAEVQSLDARYGVMLSHDRPIWLRFIEMSGLRNGMTTIALLLVIGLSSYAADHGEMSVGTFISLATWVSIAIGQATNLATLERQITWAIPPLQTMKKALELPLRVVNRTDAIVLEPNGPATVEFRNVTYTYTNAPPVLRNISFTVPPGKKVAIIGASGSGKSTLGKLILRYMDPTSGSILVNGHPLPDVDVHSWRRIAVPIRQGPQILNGTLRDNLLYGMSSEKRALITDDQLWAFMKRFRIDFGSRLTNGLDTNVGPEGVRLSGGEAQRVMIGAAVLREPRLLIIDEATSALDAGSQEAVQEALYELLNEGCSAIIIAHRLSTIARCDRFVMLRPAGEHPHEPQIEAVADSLDELSRLSPTFRSLAIKEGVLVDT